MLLSPNMLSAQYHTHTSVSNQF